MSTQQDTLWYTRRSFVRMAGLAAAAGVGALILPACSQSGSAGASAGASAVSSGAEEASSAAASSVASESGVSSSGASGASSQVESSTASAEGASSAGEATASSATDAASAAGGSKELVLIFSRADENYNVGYVEVGNTMVLAQFVQQKRACDPFELEPVVPYAADYQSCIDYALAEQERNGRPELKALPDLASYDTIFFGFPVWWGDIPMPVYTAIEALDWSGKTIAPFNTHEGSGSAGMFETLARVCAGATVLDGLTVQGSTAQNQRDTAEARVDEWLGSLGI